MICQQLVISPNGDEPDIIMSSKQSLPIKRDPAEEQSLRESSQARRIAFAESATRRRDAVVLEANRHAIQASIDAAFGELDHLERTAAPIAQKPIPQPAKKPPPTAPPPPVARALPRRVRPFPVPPPLPQVAPPEPARAAQSLTALRARAKRRRPRLVVAASIVALLAASTVSLRVVAPHHPVWTQLERAAAFFRH